MGNQLNINNSENSKYFQITSTIPLDFNYEFFTRLGMNLFSGDDNDKYNYQICLWGFQDIYFLKQNSLTIKIYLKIQITSLRYLK